MSKSEQTVLIIGAGAFGISTALHLLRRGWKSVQVIDRSPILPAPDAASTDLNKIVRTSYSDIVYTRLTKEAVAEWKKEEWGESYHETGVLVRGGIGSYGSLAFQNDITEGIRTKQVSETTPLQSFFSPQVQLGSIEQAFEGYLNVDSGWAAASYGIECGMKQVRELGGVIEGGKPVIGLNSDGTGVELEDGTEMKADIIIIATGSWTPSTFWDLGLADRIIATGQCIITIQLTKEEADVYRDIPVYLDYNTGFYMFPPNNDNIVKAGMHFAGFTHMRNQGGRPISTPRTCLTEKTEDNGSAIPRDMVHRLRKCLYEIFPVLGSKPIANTRLCWYADTSDSNWLIDFHPDHPSVMFATGGSGHAYKFMPILGRLVADRLENVLDPMLVRKFAFDRILRANHCADLTRVGTYPQELDTAQLSTPEDLMPC